MKVALIVPGGVDRSGEVRVIPVLLALIRRLAMSHDVHVFTLRQELQPSVWFLDGATIHNIGQPLTVRRAIGTILAEHRRSAFSIVHSMWAGGCGALAVTLSKLLRLPSIVHVTGGELVALNDIEYGGCRSLRGRLIARATLAGATALTCTSDPIRDLIAGFGRTAQRIPLGVDLDQWPIRFPRRRDPGATARLVHVASLNSVKDQTTLLEAMRLLADRNLDFRLDIIGEDVREGAVHALCRSLGLDEVVELHGFLTQAQLRPLVESADLAVFSSRHEAGPVAMLEAAAVGVPTVGTDVGHIHEWSGSASIAVACGDPRALAEQIERVLCDEALRLRLGNEALARARQEDSVNTARMFSEKYMQLTEGP